MGSLIMFAYEALKAMYFGLNSLKMLMICIIFGLLFSIPIFILNVWIYNKLLKTKKSDQTIRIILNAIAIAGVVIIISLITSSITSDVMLWFSTAVILGSLLLEVRPPQIRE